MVAPSETSPLIQRNTSQDRRSSDDDDLDSRFRRWKDAVTQRFRKGKQRQGDQPEWLISVFAGHEQGDGIPKEAEKKRQATRDATAQIALDIRGVRQAITEGIQPTMIQTGSSGSYFVKARDAETGNLVTKAVFKPSDEEPYGNLNPKRAFLRRYFWWAMGRPCLIPGFSAMSEAAASLLDDRLHLALVPKTQLVKLSSPAFHYAYNDRRAYEEHGQQLPEKIGSFQSFLHGYAMMSSWLRRNPFPTRPRSVLERDLEAEQLTHRKMRKREKARLRRCGVKLKHFLLCRQGLAEDRIANIDDQGRSDEQEQVLERDEVDFLWTADLIHSFRLELEKLVVFDYLCRNTDRGLDNFMIHHVKGTTSESVKLGAIDNSLAWPIKHPDGIRDYPFGWLYLPVDIIGGPFHQCTKDHFLPLLASPQWWRETEMALKELFQQDKHFNEKLFESQMAVFKGQGWNVLQSLRCEDEGPLELCARRKKVVHQSTVMVSEQEVAEFEGGKLALQTGAEMQPAPVNATAAKPIGIVTAKESAPQDSLSDANGHPRSLPETSRINVQPTETPTMSAHPPQEASQPLALGSSLGIEILQDLDRAAKKARRRPGFQKTVSGFDLGRRGVPSQSPARGRRTARPSGPVKRGLSSNDVLSEDEEEDEEDTAGMKCSSVTAESRMAQSDYFASYGRAEPMPSIGSALATDRGTTDAQSADQTKGTATSTSRPAKNRRRMRSVGNWSLLSFDGGDSTTPMATATATSHDFDPSRKVKVIMEELIDDDSQPWQSWLRA
ncbi:hypothetical protein BDZ90DRAFT_233363 [Jaminaea rosea]|uniref:Phosphatidylinositol 4-kinase n=1 Tax=Jaminaea rosea TaxID=1569628 RepID=A0A316ULW0_9BASI|nr:hypothetical protein BDZ90DRAFT_233363 [Jaminaea rosea]PWN26229.1 hypothetical protein BDZ90DRAFT_233363 [Jaminaea rosea]